ncbi:MAG: hypothetical protein ABIA93_00535 [Candidatus Woesearchaeota archaeon]
MNRKAQSMTDFLVTYGWMMVVSIAVISALAWYGVTSFEKYIPTTCTTTGLVHCSDYAVYDNAVQFRLKNNLGQPITGMVVTVEGLGNYKDVQKTITYDKLDSEDLTVPIIVPITDKGTFTGAITIEYTGRDKSISHSIKGKITGTPELTTEVPEEAAPLPIGQQEPQPVPDPIFVPGPKGGDNITLA